MTLPAYLLFFVGGTVTGTIGALLGLGGGVFLIPFLVFVCGLPMHQAIATSIIAVIATSSAGAAMNIERRTVNIRLGMLLETTTVAGAILGGLTANLLSGETLTRIFAILLLGVSVLMVWRSKQSDGAVTPFDEGLLQASFRDPAADEEVAYSVRRVPAIMGVSLLAGNVSGLLGVGGGIFKVPAMTMIAGVPIKAATATSNFMIGVTAAASAFIYLSYGHVNPFVASATAIGVLAGSFLGIKAAQRIQSIVLAWIFAGVLLLVSLRMFIF